MSDFKKTEHRWNMGHALLIDEKQSGSRALVRQALHDQVTAGGGAVIVGSSVDESLWAEIASLADSVGRGNDLIVFDPVRPAYSHTFNPVLHLSPAAVAAQMLNLVTDHDASAIDAESSMVVAFIEGLVGALQALDLPYSILDIGMFVMKPEALQRLLEHASGRLADHVAVNAYAKALECVRDADNELSIAKLKSLFSGLAGAMCMLGSGRLGEVFNSYAPDLVLDKAIAENKIVYIASPYIGKGSSGGCIRGLIAANVMHGLDNAKRTKTITPTPTLAVFLEPAMCNVPSIVKVLNSATQGKVRVWVVTESLVDMGNEFLDLREHCLTHMSSLVFFNATNLANAELYRKFMLASDEAASENLDISTTDILELTDTQFIEVESRGGVRRRNILLADNSDSFTEIARARTNRPVQLVKLAADHFTQTIPV